MDKTMRLLYLAIFATVASASQAQRVWVIHAPSTISNTEFIRLRTLAETQIFGNDQVVESTKGDVLVDLKQNGIFIVANNSELMGPVRLARELYALTKKHDRMAMIPFSELSDVALAAFKTRLWQVQPRYDVGPDSLFALDTTFGSEVRSGLFVYGSDEAPSRFGGGADRQEKQDTFMKLLAAKPLKIVRTQQDLDKFTLGLLKTTEGVYYDQTALLRPKLEVDRRGIEVFEGWAQNEQQKVDDAVANQFQNDSSWASMLKRRSIKSMEDYKRESPDNYNHLKRMIELNYQQYGLSSPNKAEDVLAKASVRFGFRFQMMSILEGSNQRFTFGPRG